MFNYNYTIILIFVSNRQVQMYGNFWSRFTDYTVVAYTANERNLFIVAKNSIANLVFWPIGMAFKVVALVSHFITNCEQNMCLGIYHWHDQWSLETFD